MNKKLYVGNLSYNVTSGQLEEMFAAAGRVESADLITDRQTGRSKGFGFVEMSTEKEAKAAMKMFSGKELDGRTLTVNEARPRIPREYRGPSRGTRVY